MNFERGINPKSALDIGIVNSRTAETLTLMYRGIMKEFKGKPHPLKKYTTEIFSQMIPIRFAGYVGWGNLDKIFYDLNDAEFDPMFNIMYNHYCEIVVL